MALQIVSDLHLEAPKGYDLFEIVPQAPHLALLGDVGQVVAHKDEYLDFLRVQLAQFRTVLLVAGNHEVYNGSWPQAIAIFNEFQDAVRNDSTLGSFVYLDRTAFQLPGSNTIVLGCSLFSRVPQQREMAVSTGLNDFFITEDWDVPAHNAKHARDLTWLNEQVTKIQNETPDKRIIICTHWSPSLDARAVNPRHANSLISSAFATNLSHEVCFTSPAVTTWAFGHTHYNCDFSVQRSDNKDPLRVVTNQRGYYFAQADGFDGKKVVTV